MEEQNIQPIVEEKKEDIQPIVEESALENAKKKIAELDKLNAELEAKMKKADSLMAESMLRGRSFAGQPNRIETEEEKIKRETKEFFKGTAVEGFLK